jgi:hypothetical protein
MPASCRYVKKPAVSEMLTENNGTDKVINKLIRFHILHVDLLRNQKSANFFLGGKIYGRLNGKTLYYLKIILERLI